jgi:hypothetical protein
MYRADNAEVSRMLDALGVAYPNPAAVAAADTHDAQLHRVVDHIATGGLRTRMLDRVVTPAEMGFSGPVDSFRYYRGRRVGGAVRDSDDPYRALDNYLDGDDDSDSDGDNNSDGYSGGDSDSDDGSGDGSGGDSDDGDGDGDGGSGSGSDSGDSEHARDGGGGDNGVRDSARGNARDGARSCRGSSNGDGASGLAIAESLMPAWVPQPLTDLSRTLTLDDDPFAALAVNDAHRHAAASDGPTADLWSVDQLSACLPRQYTYPVPTFAPRHWASLAPVAQSAYTKRFTSEFPEVMSILPIENVVVCGGAAAWPLGESQVRVGDVDLFIYGIDPADRPALWRKLDFVVRRLTRAFRRGGGRVGVGAACVTQVMTPGLVTLTAYYGAGPMGWTSVSHARKVQVVLRAYPSVSAILHAFDVPASAVAFDGARAYTTTLGAYAHVFRANLVIPAYRSTTYEARLAKYFQRGFALAMPHLRAGLLTKNEPLHLPHLTLQPFVVRGFFAAGTLAEAAGAPPFTQSSDYEGRYDQVRQAHEACEFGPLRLNLYQLAAGGRHFIIMGAALRRRYRECATHDVKAVRFDRFAEAEPSLTHVLPRAAVEQALSACARGALTGGRLNACTLRRVFSLDEAQIARLVAAVAEAQRRNVGRRLDLTPALAPFREALLQRYAESPAAIPWWIVQDPGRQHTASIDPRMEDPGQWYGDAVATEPHAPTPEDHVKSLLATLEARQVGFADERKPVFDGVCPLCHDPLVRGAANSLILPCGHIYHWIASEDGCPGLHSWVQAGHSDCPTCRARYGEGDEASRQLDPPQPVAVDVQW